MDKSLYTELIKVDETLGLVLGYAIISTVGGQPYVDLQNDHIPESVMLEAAVDFVENGAVAKEMHAGEPAGKVVFVWPMTKEIADAFKMQTDTTGLMVAMKPSNPETLEKFRTGVYTGFSIGGSAQSVKVDQ